MREQPWMRHVTHQMTKLILAHKDACKSRLVLNLSQAKRIECAVRAVIKLYCTNVSFEWVSCLHTPVDFLEFLPGNRNHHHLSDDVEYHGLQLVCHYEVGRCEVEDGDAAGGCHRGSQCIRVLRDATQLWYNFHNSHAFSSFLGIVAFLRRFVWLCGNIHLSQALQPVSVLKNL